MTEKQLWIAGWVVHWLAVLTGLAYLIVGVANINNIDFGLPMPDQPGYQAYTIAYAALRLGAAACFFLLALAVRPRPRK